MKNEPKVVVLHCADTPDSLTSNYDIKDIDEWHKKRGFNMVGYHIYIKRDGTIQKGREEDVVGAHAYGYNDNSLGICYEGRNMPMPAQMLSIINMYRQWFHKYGIDWNGWVGHCELNKEKTCPGFNMSVIRNIFRLINVDTLIK